MDHYWKRLTFFFFKGRGQSPQTWQGLGQEVDTILKFKENNNNNSRNNNKKPPEIQLRASMSLEGKVKNTEGLYVP